MQLTASESLIASGLNTSLNTLRKTMKMGPSLNHLSTLNTFKKQVNVIRTYWVQIMFILILIISFAKML